jgi:hypothetical protein
VAAVLVTEGGRRAPGGPWVGVAGWAECHLGQRGEKQRKKVGWAARMTGPKSRVGCRKFLFKFWIKDLNSNKIVLNIFKLNLNGVQTRINSNKLFEDFSNLEVLKIGLNI